MIHPLLPVGKAEGAVVKHKLSYCRSLAAPIFLIDSQTVWLSGLKFATETLTISKTSKLLGYWAPKKVAKDPAELANSVWRIFVKQNLQGKLGRLGILLMYISFVELIAFFEA